jgi:hypothetical protein
MVRLIEFVDVDIDSITFPTTKELDVVFGDAASCSSNSCTLSNRMARKPNSRNAGSKE